MRGHDNQGTETDRWQRRDWWPERRQGMGIRGPQRDAPFCLYT